MSRATRRRLALMTVLGVLLSGGVAAAGLPGAQGRDARQILADSHRRHRPKSEEYLGEIIVISKDGKERRKTWRSYRNGPPGAADRLIRFLSPADVRGVAYLAHDSPGRDPDEWLYLPSMKRERRISVKDRDAAFVGTSFSDEDLELFEFDPTRYDASEQTPELTAGGAVYVIDVIPKVASSYVKKVVRLREDNLDIVSVEFFARDTLGPVKILHLTEYAEVGGYDVATRVEMTDVRKSLRTIVVLHEIALDRPQPSDRYTIQNLLREGDARQLPPASVVSPLRLETAARDGVGNAAPFSAPAAFSGYVEAKAVASAGSGGASSSWQWATAFLRGTTRLGTARVDAAVRAEESSSAQVGPVVFDPADRRPLRSAASLRELSITIPIRPDLDVEAGRFLIAWGQTDGYSPADAFLPRDLSDPLTEERLPLWGINVRGQSNGVRFEFLAVPVLTPWRLPALGRQPLPFPSRTVTLVENPWTVPTAGFGAGRIMGTIGGWDLGAWARAGERPAPVLSPELDMSAQTSGAPLVVPVDRHFASERAVGGSASHAWGGWILDGELGVFHSGDPAVGDAAIWTIGGSRLVRNGLVTATVAANAIAPPTNPLLMFDRALLPAVILAVEEYESWGSWRIVGLGTFHTVGGILSVEATRNLTDAFGLTLGADLPDGAALSPATAFSGGKRGRVTLRWSW
jgi:hypothetical protein